MPRKKSDARDTRSVKREKKTSQLLERGETPPADERLDPQVDSPGESTDEGAPANDASYDLNRQGDWARHSTGGTSGARGREGMAQSERGTWGEDQSRRERREEQRGGAGAAAGASRPRRKSDDSLAREILEILTADPELDATDIGVEVEGGAVTLSGEVMHPDARLLAEELTESIAGVRLVHNRLVVRR